MSSLTEIVSRCWVVSGIALIGCALMSCNIVAPVYAVIEGPPTVPAVYELDPERSIVAVIDDRGNGFESVVPRRSLRRDIGEAFEQTLIDRRVVPAENVIRAMDALRLMANESSGELMPAVEIGRRLGAEVVIYVNVTGFSITTDGTSLSPRGTARVQVFDAEANAFLAPAGGGYFTVDVEPPAIPGSVETADRDDVQDAQRVLAVALGTRLAFLFFEHERLNKVEGIDT